MSSKMSFATWRWTVRLGMAFSVMTLARIGVGDPGPLDRQVPPRDGKLTVAAIGTAVIRGRVVTLDGGKPLRRVQIRVVGSEGRNPRLLITDQQGIYEVKGLPAGRYQLTASKSGYVTLGYGQRRPFDASKPVELTDGQTIEKIDFQLPRGGAITGRVTDEFGEPVADVNVSVLRYRRSSGHRRLSSVGRSATTDDLGHYRLYGLEPGEYYLAAQLKSSMMNEGTVEISQGYAPTYFAGSPVLAEAQPVAVAVGDELNADPGTRRSHGPHPRSQSAAADPGTPIASATV